MSSFRNISKQSVSTLSSPWLSGERDIRLRHDTENSLYLKRVLSIRSGTLKDYDLFSAHILYLTNGISFKTCTSSRMLQGPSVPSFRGNSYEGYAEKDQPFRSGKLIEQPERCTLPLTPSSFLATVHSHPHGITLSSGEALARVPNLHIYSSCLPLKFQGVEVLGNKLKNRPLYLSHSQ